MRHTRIVVSICSYRGVLGRYSHGSSPGNGSRQRHIGRDFDCHGIRQRISERPVANPGAEHQLVVYAELGHVFCRSQLRAIRNGDHECRGNRNRPGGEFNQQ